MVTDGNNNYDGTYRIIIDTITTHVIFLQFVLPHGQSSTVLAGTKRSLLCFVNQTSHESISLEFL